MRQVVVYLTEWCPYCSMARKLLDSHNANWTEIDIEKEGLTWAQMAQIIIGGKDIGGFTELYALDQAGQLAELLKG